jgi:DNA-binding PadR family transcriptional regulator
MHQHHEHHGNGERSRTGRRARPTPEARAAFGGFSDPEGQPHRGHGDAHSHGRGRGGRARRGDVLASALALLNERPMHGYEIIQELSARTAGIWKLSPGSIYPLLQKLADRGIVLAEEDGGKRRFSLTDAGRALASRVSSHAPWEEIVEDRDPATTLLKEAVDSLVSAAAQIVQVGTPAQQEEAVALLGDARRRLYGILASEA